MANINLLPWREEQREERKQRFFVALGITAVVAAAIVGVGDRYESSRISNQNSLNSYLREQIANVDHEIVEIRQLQEQKKALSERMAVIQDLQGKRPVIVRLFDELVRTLPDGVYYNSIRRVNDTISLEGVAESNNRVSTLMRALDDSDWFANPDLEQVTALPGGTVNAAGGQDNSSNTFKLTVTLTAGQEEEKQP